MAFKKMDKYFSFADIAVQKYAHKNRSLQFLKEINDTIDWKPVDDLLIKFYPVGKSKEGERLYPPLFLFKCMLLQKWFQIKSDPELESQIYDRISFKVFLDLSIEAAVPDHSTFSRFRKRLSEDAMIQINSALLKQFYKQGVTINKGVAVDARLVKSASKAISKEKIEKLKNHLDTPEGKLDRNGQKKKYSRDHESDWTVKNDKPHYGLKEHASVDTDNGFILSTHMTPASHHDSPYFPRAIIHSMHTKDKIETGFGDKGYDGLQNREFLSLNNIKDGIMRKNHVNSKLTDLETNRNKAISRYRYIVEQYFGISHLHDRGDRARFPKLTKNVIDLMFRQFAFNSRKGAKILGVFPV